MKKFLDHGTYWQHQKNKKLFLEGKSGYLNFFSSSIAKDTMAMMKGRKIFDIPPDEFMKLQHPASINFLMRVKVSSIGFILIYIVRIHISIKKMCFWVTLYSSKVSHDVGKKIMGQLSRTATLNFFT